jgi:tetratricopeptide (TPR) repeat protein
MALPKTLETRQVIPRWVTPTQAAQAGERSVANSPRALSMREQGWLSKLIQRFDEDSDINSATDLYLAQTVAGQIPSSRAAEIFRRSGPGRNFLKYSKHDPAPLSIKALSLGDIRLTLHKLKLRLRDNPHLALDWSELARHYTLIGQRDSAKRAMNIALHVSGPNRYIYRAAVRLFVHLDDFDGAAALIRRHPAYREDPWLLSAEIAVSAIRGKTSNQMSRALSLVKASGTSPRHIAELAAAVATVELSTGDIRQAKRLYSTSLISPNENTIAQVEWAHQKDRKIPHTTSIITSSEAMVWRAKGTQAWSNVVENCRSWLAAEPYSARPAMMGAFYVDITSRDFALMAEFATTGLVANPKNPTLLNDHAVALAYMGNIKEAIKQISAAINAIEHDAENIPVLLATLGLISVRGGAVEQGEALYLRSLDRFTDQKNRAAAVLAALHWTREEIRLGYGEVPRLLASIKKAAKKLPLTLAHEIQAMLAIVEGELKQTPKSIFVEPAAYASVLEAVPRLEAALNQKITEKATSRTRAARHVADLLDP